MESYKEKMGKNKKGKINNQSGAAMLISVIFFLFISLAIIAGLVSPTVREFKNANVNLNSKQSYFLAESSNEDVLYRIIRNMSVSEQETLTLGSNSATTEVTTIFGNTKEVVSLGDVLNFQRTVSSVLRTGTGVVFKYGTQAGQGGFVFQNNAYVEGNIYSNGNVIGSNGAYVTGDIFVAGSTGLVSNMRAGYGAIGDVHAHTVTGSTVTGTIYCQSGSSNNKACNTSQPDPQEEDLPISDEDIAQWKTEAADFETTSGNVTISTPTTIGPRKIIGDLTINKTLTIGGTIYVTGNIIINAVTGLPSMKLDSGYGESSGVVIADGRIVINNGVEFEDSGTAGSYILLLSESACDDGITASPCYGNNAIEISNNSDISIVNAQKGTVYFSNNATVKEAVGYKIELKNNVGISYGSGIIDVGFTGGPSGSWVIDSWNETE